MGGIGLGSSYRSACSCNLEPRVIKETLVVNTSTIVDPKDFVIEMTQQIGDFLIAMVRYPNCSNYEGKKIMVYKGLTLDDIIDKKVLDPHFCDNCSTAPIARFEPTDRGWAWALNFANLMK